MNISLWILCGSALGWIGYAVFHANAQRGMPASVSIGALGGLLGGMMIAPMLGAIVEPGNALHPFSLVIAMTAAIACLTISNMISKRFGV